ncbi:alpha/beta hydrolase [Paenibacillus sp. FSL F4-0236]|uniref:alpha/beta hydrolase n=1 Tax=Paenibacillus sp. FSL F4-0236 TaxID=2954731 RepID=UPI0030F70A78
MQQIKQTASWRPRSLIQWLLTFLSVVVLPVIVMLAYYLLVPSDMNKIMSGLAWAMSLFPVVLLIITLVIIVLLVLAFWKKALIARTILIPLLLLLIFLIVQPIISMLSYAKSENISVSLSSHFFNKQDITKEPMQNVVYGKTTDGVELKLDVWTAKENSENTLKPAIVQVHGGGWVEGDKGQAPHWNQWLNELGYTVFDVQYRMPPHGGWKDEVGDIKSALGWVLTNADTYKIDSKRINLMGYSAGGNLAMLAAYSMGSAQLPPSTNVPEVHINSVINFYGPADMTIFYKNNPSIDYVQGVMKQYIGGAPSQYPDRYKILSPINYIQENTPPTITFFGTGDRIVPEKQGKILDKALAVNGVAHEFYLLPEVDHAFDTNPGSLSTQFAREKVTVFLQKYNK